MLLWKEKIREPEVKAADTQAANMTKKLGGAVVAGVGGYGMAASVRHFLPGWQHSLYNFGNHGPGDVAYEDYAYEREATAAVRDDKKIDMPDDYDQPYKEA